MIPCLNQSERLIPYWLCCWWPFPVTIFYTSMAKITGREWNYALLAVNGFEPINSARLYLT